MNIKLYLNEHINQNGFYLNSMIWKNNTMEGNGCLVTTFLKISSFVFNRKKETHTGTEQVKGE